MQSTLETPPRVRPMAARTQPAPADLHHRRHSLGRTPSRLARLGQWLQERLEQAVARRALFGDPHIYENRLFPWVTHLEQDWQAVRLELDQVMCYRDQIPSFHEILKEASTITTDHDWKTYFLSGIGMDCRENAQRCPETMRLLEKIPGLMTAFFSILSPGKHIPAHRGAYNGVLRLHLGLLVPSPKELCRIRIGNDFRHWNEGEALIFDDTFNHEVWNDTDGFRVVLFVDFARPLRQPWHWLNQRLLRLCSLAPFLREAGAKQKAWEKRFYR